MTAARYRSPAVPMSQPERQRVSAAAYQATRLWPGAPGELIARELRAWADFGWRLGRDSDVRAAVDTINRLVNRGGVRPQDPDVSAFPLPPVVPASVSAAWWMGRPPCKCTSIACMCTTPALDAPGVG